MNYSSANNMAVQWSFYLNGKADFHVKYHLTDFLYLRRIFKNTQVSEMTSVCANINVIWKECP